MDSVRNWAVLGKIVRMRREMTPWGPEREGGQSHGGDGIGSSDGGTPL